MPEGHHKQVTIPVWVDVDEGIAEAVLHLNTIPGIRTLASCQGTIGEGGPKPYRAQVMVTWTDESLKLIQTMYDITVLGHHWGYAHPRS
jgi:hypothetical protein